MDNDKGKFKTPPLYILKIIEGIDKGKRFILYGSKKYTVGRAKDCEIIIDHKDKTASRRHAIMTVEKSKVILENLSETNPTILNHKKIKKITIIKGDQFQVGSTVLELEGYNDGVHASHKSSSKSFRIAACLVLIIAVASLIYITKYSPSNTSKNSIDIKEEERKGQSEIAVSAHKEHTIDQPNLEKVVDVPIADKKRANEHFRKGIFFYDAGKLKKAIDEWDRAILLDQTHPHAKKWLIRAEDEIDKLVKKHYQRALINSKYMRYNEAINEFRIVIELSRNKYDESYLNSMKKLKELELK